MDAIDVVILSRLQFALATIFHFFYVPLTLGMALFIAIMETRYYRTKNEIYKSQALFWGRIFIINFVLGVVTGITLEFQFGTNWATYSTFVGDIFGPLLAVEATAAFFLESTFIAVWIWGRDKVSPRAHLASIWLVSGAGFLSALWIILANGFMQNPVGYAADPERNRVVLDNFIAVITNPYGWWMFLHTITGAILLGGFVVMGVSALNILRRKNAEFFHMSFKLGMWFALISSILVAGIGHQLGQVTAKYQPAKLAAMESQWETTVGADMHLLVIPSLSDKEENLLELLPIPGFMSFLAYGDFNAEVKGLKHFPPEDRPPVLPVFIAFRLMVGLGTLFILVSIFSFLVRNHITKFKYILVLYVLMIPLPYMALELGWIVTEMGRQPWVVYGLQRTAMAHSAGVDWYQVAGSLAVMGAVYTALTALGFFLMGRAALKAPPAYVEAQ